MTTAAALLHPRSMALSLARADRLVLEETLALLRHVQHCELARSRWFVLSCLGERVNGYLAPRIITTLAAALALLWTASLYV